MGYTHYHRDLTPDAQLAEAARKIVEASDVPIFGGDGEGEPVIEDDIISLNGNAATEEDHETFYVIPDSGFAFCKTVKKPYDEVVTAILIYAILNGTQGAENIRSDGDVVDWIDGIHLYEKCYGRMDDEQFVRLVDAIGEPKIYSVEKEEWVDIPVPLDARSKLEDTATWLDWYRKNR